jgi:hypothetical protein
MCNFSLLICNFMIVQFFKGQITVNGWRPCNSKTVNSCLRTCTRTLNGLRYIVSIPIWRDNPFWRELANIVLRGVVEAMLLVVRWWISRERLLRKYEITLVEQKEKVLVYWSSSVRFLYPTDHYD